MIKIFLDRLMYSPLDFPRFREYFLKKHKIQIVKSVGLADIIASSYMIILKKYAQRFNKRRKYLLWTHEPYHDFSYKSQMKLRSGVIIHIMNIYTGDVFTHPLRYFYFNQSIKEIDEIPELNRDVLALSTFYDSDYYVKNKYSILDFRYKLIEAGIKSASLSLHGKGWNKHKSIRSISNSRNDSDRRVSKEELLKDCHFNLCLENTDFKNYVTEKIWEPIFHGCLPIYYGNKTIYKLFPEESFIDAAKYLDCPDKLFSDIKNMTVEEFLYRYNKCVNVFNENIGKIKIIPGKSKNLNINYLEYETCSHKLLQKIKSI